MSAEENVIVVGRKSITDYVLSAILVFNEGFDEIIIRGQGSNISKAVDVYNALTQRLHDSIELISVRVDSITRGRKLIPLIEIKVKRTI
jgi:DNA-binding protein Alba